MTIKNNSVVSSVKRIVRLVNVDSLTLSVNNTNIKCKVGCYSCCKRWIEISVAEAIIIRNELVNSGKWDYVKLKCTEYADVSKNSNETSWFLMNLPCVLLDMSNATCCAYSVRPPQCSLHFVTSDSSVCHPWKYCSEKPDVIDSSSLVMKFVGEFTHAVGESVLSFRSHIPVALLIADRISSYDIDNSHSYTKIMNDVINGSK